MTHYPEIWNALAAEFHPDDVKERDGRGGRKFRYITARTAMNRLDEVFGWENWSDDYERDPNGSDNVLCRLTVVTPDGKPVTKCDVGSPGDTGEEGEDDKGAHSDAFKRAAVKFGVGRYLYRDGVYRCPTPKTAGEETTPIEPSHGPTPPAPKVPSREGLPSQGRPPHPPEPEPMRREKPPTDGRSLFKWCKTREERDGVGLLKYLNSWAKPRDFPGRMVEWDADQVAEGYAEAVRKLQAMPAMEPAPAG